MTEKKEEKKGFLATIIEIFEDVADMAALGDRVVDNAKSLTGDGLKNELPARAKRISESRKK